MPLVLAGGLQSSGSTLVSWCFLQRHDTDGILDARFDQIPPHLPRLNVPFTWCKLTIACFRLAEVVEHFRDEGWDVRPLLIVRDVRSVFGSLLSKEYGRNGTTADDPPLRLRLRRFLADYRLARRENWPIIRYEDLFEFPESTLRTASCRLGLPWDESMLTWPKDPARIADARHGNATFVESRGDGLAGSLLPNTAPSAAHILCDDLDWLEETFCGFNRDMKYPARIGREGVRPGRAVPTFEVTRRAWRERKRGFLSLFVRSPSRTPARESKTHSGGVHARTS